jgi:hypothetical protein
VVEVAAANLVPVYSARRDGTLDSGLSQPLNREIIEALDPVAAAGISQTSQGEEVESQEVST